MFSPAVHTADAAAKCPAAKVSPSSQKAASAKPKLAKPATAWHTRESRRSGSLIRACSVPLFPALWQARQRDADHDQGRPLADDHERAAQTRSLGPGRVRGAGAGLPVALAVDRARPRLRAGRRLLLPGRPQLRGVVRALG